MPLEEEAFTVEREMTVVSAKSAKEQNREEAAATLSGDLQAAGGDQIKKLDVLLKHLEKNTITKAEFIEKLTVEAVEAVIGGKASQILPAGGSLSGEGENLRARPQDTRKSAAQVQSQEESD